MRIFRMTLAVFWCLLALLAKKEDAPKKQEKALVQVEVDSFVPQEYEYARTYDGAGVGWLLCLGFARTVHKCIVGR